MVDRTRAPPIPGLHQSFTKDYREFSQLTPNYWAWKAAGYELPMNIYQWSNYECDSPPVTFPTSSTTSDRRSGSDVALRTGWDHFHAGGTIFGTPGYTQQNIAGNGFRILENKLLQKVRGHSFNLGVLMGEINETASFIQKSVTTIAKGFRGLLTFAKDLAAQSVAGLPRNRRKIEADRRYAGWADYMRNRGSRHKPSARELAELQRRARLSQRARDREYVGVNRLGEIFTPGRLPQALRNRYLEWSYAVKPLLSDIEGMMQQCYRSETRGTSPLRNQLVRASHKETLKGNRTSAGWPKSLNSFTSNFNGAVRFKGTCVFYEDSPFKKTMEEIGLANPGLIGWELIPLSFVVDWFIPVGDWIQNIVPPQGVVFVRGWVKMLLESTETQGYTFVLVYNPTTFVNEPYTWFRTITSQAKWRSPLGELPQWRVPDFAWPFDGGKALASLALLSACLTDIR